MPTWLVALAIYGGWIALIMEAYRLPWFVFGAMGTWLVTWHFSLQHEAIHGWLSVPRWVRHVLVWPPIGGWLPFELYRRSHSQHHRDVNLTQPKVDTESVYHSAEDWARYSRGWRAVLMFNQTLLGRLMIGPLLRLRKLVLTEGGMLLHGNFSNLGIWLRFGAGLAAVLWFVSAIGGVPVWKYYLLVVYPGFSLGLLRAFIEHRWGESPEERVGIIESNVAFGTLYLWNNLHIVHHLHPSLAWFEIPAYYRARRSELLELNGSYRFAGYLEIARRWMLRPVFVPVHPGGDPR